MRREDETVIFRYIFEILSTLVGGNKSKGIQILETHPNHCWLVYGHLQAMYPML